MTQAGYGNIISIRCKSSNEVTAGRKHVGVSIVPLPGTAVRSMLHEMTEAINLANSLLMRGHKHGSASRR